LHSGNRFAALQQQGKRTRPRHALDCLTQCIDALLALNLLRQPLATCLLLLLLLLLLVLHCLQDGRQCTTRNLRENHGFSGLMMDGGNSRPEINLQQVMMFSHNIAQLFKKHKVPHPGFDHLTVDLDQNTFWIALAVMRGSYRPRSLAVEINRNFAWHDSYATVDMPQEMAFTADGCATLTGEACGAAAGVGESRLLATCVGFPLRVEWSM
jgi:hypothetical protein